MRVEHIGDATLYLADCRDVLPTLEADALVTDPPYGIGIAANPIRQAHAVMDWDDATPPADLLASMLLRTRWQIIWGGNYFDLPPCKKFLVWDKMQGEEFSTAMCEQAWTNLDGPAKMFRFSARQSGTEHPTQKPLHLMQWCISYIPETARTIIDPFMGSGTTGVACAHEGRRFIGIEREPAYFDIACKRIADAYAQPRLFAPSPPAKPVQPSMFEAAQ